MSDRAGSTAPRRANPAGLAIYAAVVLSVVMTLFPPYTGVGGTEYAFVVTGPEWSRQLSPVAESLGLAPHIDWTALLVQYAAVWAMALGSARLLGTRRDDTPRQDVHPNGR